MNRQSNVFLPNTLTPNECHHFVSLALTLTPVNADMGLDTSFPEIRSSIIRWIYKNDHRFTWMFDRLLPVVETANAGSFGFAIDELQSLQFTEYHSDRQGQYKDHVDLFVVSNGETDRKLSFVVQLTDPSFYTGGDLYIHCDNHPDPTALRQQGSLVVFPSFLQHVVRPVTAGFRYSLVGWCTGPRFV